MLLTRPLQAFGAIFGHKPFTKRSIEQKTSKNYLEGNSYPAPNQQLDWYIIQLETLMSNAKSNCTDGEIAAWLRGLLTIAWADGNFDENEQKMIASLTQDELNPVSFETGFEPITAEELAAVFGTGTANGENFLRTAVMVALADGTYSLSEDEVLYKFCTALGHNVEAIESLRHTIEDSNSQPQGPSSQTAVDYAATPLSGRPQPQQKNVLTPVKDWLDGWEVHDPRVARFVCKMIPPQCPFERDVVLFGRKIVHIPPMCKLNPLYEQLVGMRFRALCYLADDCKEDVSSYC
ncbi:MAG: Mo-dependent nitrogenase [Microcoleus sp. PH2017_01_SCD_O_A]|uniref:Mo-dependent nitrogenase C-terminal domain-containing protein n=1 Tax=unclassified Microcoleus TaxID=2642155 RepID=UPI001D4A89CA|nr:MULTISPECIES: Mo-dependent nitrogenase C-terminal domain-containing protein [unclassified Microcoleus]MCC3423281.1 Mo-dependent nitrogenase [Microcoleus sp. PH2017_01_SCD_O_A]MCC3453510.1 Mo-dependent nitrogenase [Microcoleus sp. PH2017_08_TRC_O_A]MCC3517158.1 Mo-dependent nitrogenase [Microcoleus sp. PH2017_18_LLB_O_A]MCC3571747.1 Mo-dependent nitrogenase [Microcoleus sp. PH2017_34_RAT_O_A]MCC3609365.1 Mo-dependent nitrogenase [Microcoleus sp. PH2017_40_RAT_O_B]